MQHIPSDQPTMPNPALQPRGKKAPVIPHPMPHHVPMPPQAQQQPARPLPNTHKKAKKRSPLLWIIPSVFLGIGSLIVGMIAMGLMLVYSNGILPAVYVSDVALGGLSEAEAAIALNQEWTEVILRDGERTWSVNPTTLGITLDANETASQAYALGRTNGNPLNALFFRAEVSPIVTVNGEVALAELTRIAEQINIPPIEAGVAFENGQVVATPHKNGRSIDANATIQTFARAIQAGNSTGEIELAMVDIAPALTDVSPIVAQARALLSNPLEIKVYDPVTGDSVFWSSMPNEWGQWLTVTPDKSSAIGLALNANPDLVRDFLATQANNVLDNTRSIDIESGVQSVVDAIRRGTPAEGYVTVKHNERVHTVQSGESITSIAWDYGVPYLYIQNLNDGLEGVSVGQQIRIPPADVFLSGSVNPSKRIVVNISNQNVKVYENDQLKWDWAASTGIPDSPTWTGVYQIQSHVDNAYAANWNLYMPNFMGVYQPVPGADFTNGFHGFPTRGGGQLLWENSLGRKVTYGCILLHDNNMQQLYSWAEEGVVVEIQA